MAQLPVFAAGTSEKLEPALESGILTYPSYVYIRDKKKLAFVDADLTINEIVGNNPESVIKVNSLPSVKDANEDVLYIYNSIVYTFNGTDFTPMYQDLSDLSDRVDCLEDNMHSPIQWIEL